VGLIFAPAALAYSDALKGEAGASQPQAAGTKKIVSPTPKKITPTPMMKMAAVIPTKKVMPTATAKPVTKKQVRMATATPKPTVTPPVRHSYAAGTGIPTSKVGEPLGIGMKNISPTPSRYKSVIPTATARPK
jgi:hypothetical protein